jgi:hypothetical protein
MRLLLNILVIVPLSFLPGIKSGSVTPTEKHAYSYSVNSLTRQPSVGRLEQVTQLPAELPQRVMGLAYDGENLWASIYLGRGHYATFNPATAVWKVSDSDQQHSAIKLVAGAFESPGALCFANNRLWVGGSYGESFGSIDLQTWQVVKLIKGKYREDTASQSYSSMACDGSNVWIAWHWFKYKLPVSETELLLKVDPETGKVINQYPLPTRNQDGKCSGSRNDGTHGLTWDGVQLWHIKDNMLTALDPSNGTVTAYFELNQLKRPSGLAWDGNALWISEFDGKIWRLPFD